MKCKLLPLIGSALLLGLLFGQAAQQSKTGPATEKRFPPLKVPPGFKVTLFACDPLIEYPSVIAVGPKPGAIFVAIDYMTGLGSDGKVKSEIRLVEDTDGDGYADKATVVAKDFNSIQGLAYHNDTLFVMHAPYLTALRFDKKSKETDRRKDLLTGLGLKPEDNPSRLHCANGVVVGHDGWLYLAVGDNGVDVPRPEGDRLVYMGGGILRCRTDGRDLHLFSTGLRNIYDIALDADLNVFTRDNENDGGTYMIRVCHCFHGSDHGYPYDYEERPDHAMKPIGDFGLGSSAGGVCYLETQFPKEYRGNLFFCEWGKSVVRYELKRAAAGFAPVKELEFAVGNPKDTYPFKPTDVVVQRDGTLMVSDYADGQRPKRGRGRIYHIAHVGRDSDRVKPGRGLNAESYFERCEEQVELERLGVKGLLELKDIGTNGRMHVIWALARHGPDAVAPLLRFAEIDGDARVRAQAIRAIADLADPVLVKHKLDAGRGDAELAKKLAGLYAKQSAVEKLEVVIALARLRWADAPAWAVKNLDPADDALRHAALQLLRRADNWPAVLELLDLPDRNPLRTIALRALADQHDETVVVHVLNRLPAERDAKRKGQYAEILARAYKKPGPWKYWGYRPGPRVANSVAWERTEMIEKTLGTLIADEDFGVRTSALKLLQREKIPVADGLLIGWLKQEGDPQRAAVLIPLVGAYGSKESRHALYVLGVNGKTSDANRLLALDWYFKGSGADLGKDLLNVAANLSLDHGPVLADVLRRLGQQPKFTQPILFVVDMAKSKSAEVRAAAVEAIGALQLEAGRKPALDLLADPDSRVRRAAASAVGKLGVKEAIEPLLKLAASADVDTRGSCLDSLRMLREPRVLKFASYALSEPTLELTALACFAELGGPADANLVVDHAKRHPSTDVVAMAVRALAAWRDRAGTTEKDRQELYRAIAEIHGAGGILVHWDVSVPYNPGGRDGIVKVMGVPGKRTKFWQTQFSSGAEGRLTLPAIAGDSSARYQFTEIEVPLATPVEFLASSRSTLDVWLNGKSIHRRAAPAKYQVDSDRFAATLQPGMNRVLLEAGSADSPIEFHLRFRRKSSKAEHEKLTQAALTRTGNAERGRKVFFDKEKSQCIKCHQLGNQGERIGPELTGVGNRFSRIYLVESILEPSRTIAPSFGTWTITLKNGKQYGGVKLAENDKTLTLADNQGQKHVLMKADIEEQNASAVSTMPDGLELRMTEDEFVDLIAFLASQKDAKK